MSAARPSVPSPLPQVYHRGSFRFQGRIRSQVLVADGSHKSLSKVGGEGGQLRTVTAVVEDSSEGVYE